MKEPQPLTTNINTGGLDTSPPSIIATLFWALFLYIVPSLVASFGFGIYAGASGISDTQGWLIKVETLLAMTFAVYLFVMPCVYALARHSDSHKSALNFLQLNKPTVKLLWFVVIVSAVFWLLMTIATYLLALEEEPFMQLLKNSSLPVWFVVLNTCILAPITEELVFRGWLFKRFALTRLGQTGAIAITSLLFAAIHIQYSMAGIVFVFLLGLYFTWIRVKYQSTTLAILAHAVCNSITMVALYFYY
ncbi:CPBP family intramembrane glutamic endopeptidase [Thalassotalea euphylliae]|uniref:CPBP family intramembrane glutamic endopeptidase n=1 Tax=Thalassotalea euphylliae TaxID=1655234 RepID=UPI0015F2671A|nr:type II CAAX endopeptidase family protein [Thalassotalea euphylliae]